MSRSSGPNRLVKALMLFGDGKPHNNTEILRLLGGSRHSAHCMLWHLRKRRYLMLVNDGINIITQGGIDYLKSLPPTTIVEKAPSVPAISEHTLQTRALELYASGGAVSNKTVARFISNARRRSNTLTILRNKNYLTLVGRGINKITNEGLEYLRTYGVSKQVAEQNSCQLAKGYTHYRKTIAAFTMFKDCLPHGAEDVCGAWGDTSKRCVPHIWAFLSYHYKRKRLTRIKIGAYQITKVGLRYLKAIEKYTDVKAPAPEAKQKAPAPEAKGLSSDSIDYLKSYNAALKKKLSRAISERDRAKKVLRRFANTMQNQFRTVIESQCTTTQRPKDEVLLIPSHLLDEKLVERLRGVVRVKVAK